MRLIQPRVRELFYLLFREIPAFSMMLLLTLKKHVAFWQPSSFSLLPVSRADDFYPPFLIYSRSSEFPCLIPSLRGFSISEAQRKKNISANTSPAAMTIPREHGEREREPRSVVVLLILISSLIPATRHLGSRDVTATPEPIG